MRMVFDFFLRLFWAFLLARLLLHPIGDPGAWLGLTLGLVAASYLYRPLVWLYRSYCQPRLQLWGWRWSRFLISLNRLRRHH